jgi:DNA invertase Pin-like site-specific DNA recombinase/predicted nucleotidyltransferase
MTIFGYARVSANDQTLDSLVEALKVAGCETIFREKLGGAHAGRAELSRLLAMIDNGDVLLVTRLDRLARSTRDLLAILDRLAARGAAFRSLGDGWADTTTPQGRLMLPALSGLAAFERELIRSRTGEGRIRARARGARTGRPPKLTPYQRREALQALANGNATQADLVRRFNVSQSTISRLAEKADALPVRPALDAQTERATLAFMRRIVGRYPVREGILFGSRARGAHTAESDADIAVVLNGARGDRTAATLDMAGIAFDVLLETGVLVEALPLWEDEFRRAELFSNPALVQNIRREGVRL